MEIMAHHYSYKGKYSILINTNQCDDHVRVENHSARQQAQRQRSSPDYTEVLGVTTVTATIL